MNFAQAIRASGGLKVKDITKVGKYFSAQGGLNTMDSPLVIPPGDVVGCLNYEPSIISGYRRASGYERFDGRASPTDSTFYTLSYTSVGGFTPAVGATVTESGSAATGIVAYLDTANAVVVLVSITGAFAGAGSTLTSGAQTAVSVGTPLLDQGATQALSAAYYYQKWLYFQAFIGPVGGALCAGPVLGVWAHAGAVYAWRNNAAGTQALMFVAGATGWTQVTLGIKVRYKAGVYSASMTSIPEGTTLTGAVSGATMIVKRVATLSGTWGTDAAGYFIVASITGTPTANEALTSGGVTYCTYLSNAAQTIAPGGDYHFRSYNFLVSQSPATGYRIYGVSGVDHGFEYDPVGGVYVAIETGMAADTPTRLEVHATKYLFFSFPGGSVQNSGFQLPLNWNPVFGADERSVESDVTFMREDVSGTLFIATRRMIWRLAGDQVEQFQIAPYSTNNGAISHTDEIPGQIIFAEDRGITTMSASAQYGDFAASTLTNKILNLITGKLTTGTPAGAILTRSKNLYRLIFTDGSVFCTAVNVQGQFAGWTPLEYAHTVNCASASLFGTTQQNNYERSFIGCVDGYVRELDKGYSFDGQTVSHFLKFSYYHMGSPDYIKHFRKAQIDMQPEGQSTVVIGFDCDYGNGTGMVSPISSLTSGGAFWDVGNWGQFTWGAPTYTPVGATIDMDGVNISLTISGNAVNDSPFTVTGVSYQYTPRVINRNTQEG